MKGIMDEDKPTHMSADDLNDGFVSYTFFKNNLWQCGLFKVKFIKILEIPMVKS